MASPYIFKLPTVKLTIPGMTEPPELTYAVKVEGDAVELIETEPLLRQDIEGSLEADYKEFAEKLKTLVAKYAKDAAGKTPAEATELDGKMRMAIKGLQTQAQLDGQDGVDGFLKQFIAKKKLAKKYTFRTRAEIGAKVVLLAGGIVGTVTASVASFGALAIPGILALCHAAADLGQTVVHAAKGLRKDMKSVLEDLQKLKKIADAGKTNKKIAEASGQVLNTLLGVEAVPTIKSAKEGVKRCDGKLAVLFTDVHELAGATEKVASKIREVEDKTTDKEKKKFGKLVLRYVEAQTKIKAMIAKHDDVEKQLGEAKKIVDTLKSDIKGFLKALEVVCLGLEGLILAMGSLDNVIPMIPEVEAALNAPA